MELDGCDSPDERLSGGWKTQRIESYRGHNLYGILHMTTDLLFEIDTSKVNSNQTGKAIIDSITVTSSPRFQEPQPGTITHKYLITVMSLHRFSSTSNSNNYAIFVL